MKRIIHVMLLTSIIAIGFTSCKKKKEVNPSVRDQLIGIWKGDKATPKVTAAGLDLSSLGVNQPIGIDSVTIDIKSDGNFTSTVGSQVVTGQWSLESNDTKIKLSGFTFNVSKIGGIPLANANIPDTFDIKEIAGNKITLKTSFNQTVTLPGFPLPVSASVELEMGFNKQ